EPVMRLTVGILFAIALAMGPASAGAQTCRKNPDCADGNPCTNDKCNKTTKSCVHTPVANGTACTDSDPCTRNDTCQAGVCVAAPPAPGEAADQCHGPGTCDPGTGQCSNPSLPDGTACTDYNLCTQTDVCQAGSCVGGNPIICTAVDGCHLVGTCEPTTG